MPPLAEVMAAWIDALLADQELDEEQEEEEEVMRAVSRGRPLGQQEEGG